MQWHIRLFGTLRVQRIGQDGAEFSRFSTRKTGALLAYLAFYADQPHTRDGLCDWLWPDEAPSARRARLRVALTSLRHQLEPPGIAAQSVLRSRGKEQIQLASEAITTDVAEARRALQSLHPAAERTTEARLSAARQLVTVFQEPLLTGLYDDWIIRERDGLTQEAVTRLSALAPDAPLETGLELARHAARLDPLSEEPLLALLPLLAKSGQSTLRHATYQEFARRLETTLGTSPSRKLQALAETLSAEDGASAALPPSPAVVAVPSPATPAPPSRPAPPRRLPSYLTRFFGREAECRALRQLLTETPLVTLTGPGGTGKTRLSVEIARTWDGASFFVPLADNTDIGQIPAAICDALGEKTKGTMDSPGALLERAMDALATLPTPLLVLDNLEQIADTVGSLVLTLIERVPSLRLLATSRLRLHLPGEQEFPLPPLPLPPLTGETLDTTARIASVALFVDRARAVRPDFQITARNGSDLVQVCQMLEGNPLAIELVAARGGSLVLSQMRDNLAAQGSLLISDRRAGQGERHHSLYNAIDWSYRLLPPDLQRFFAHLSLFRGSFTVEAAQAVCAVTGENIARDALARLQAHSLVQNVVGMAQMRFSLLESIRAFGLEQLTHAEQEAGRERHAAWFVTIAERADDALHTSAQAFWLEELEADRPNLRLVMDRDLGTNPPRALQLTGALWNFWNLRGRPTEGRQWLERALAACPPPSTDAERETQTRDLRHRSRALQGAGALAVLQGEGKAADPLYAESLRLRRQLDDPLLMASILNNIGLLAMARQEWDAALQFMNESLTLRRTAGAPSDSAGPLLNLGAIEWDRGNIAASQPYFEEALALFRQAGDHVGEGRALNNLGNSALALEHFADAERWFEQSLAVKRIAGHPPGIAITLSNIGVAALYQERYAVAQAYCEEALSLFREMESRNGIVDQLRNLGQIATYQQDWPRAYALLAESLTLARTSDLPNDIAGNLEAFAIFAAARAESALAAQLLGAADTLRHTADMPLYPSERAALDKAAAHATRLLGPSAFSTAFTLGTTLPLDAATTLALTLTP